MVRATFGARDKLKSPTTESFVKMFGAVGDHHQFTAPQTPLIEHPGLGSVHEQVISAVERNSLPVGARWTDDKTSHSIVHESTSTITRV